MQKKMIKYANGAQIGPTYMQGWYSISIDCSQQKTAPSNPAGDKCRFRFQKIQACQADKRYQPCKLEKKKEINPYSN